MKTVTIPLHEYEAMVKDLANRQKKLRVVLDSMYLVETRSTSWGYVESTYATLSESQALDAAIRELQEAKKAVENHKARIEQQAREISTLRGALNRQELEISKMRKTSWWKKLFQ